MAILDVQDIHTYYGEAYVPANSPGTIEHWLRNQYYKTEEEFVEAIAETMRTEYKAIVDAASAYAHVDMQAKYDARNPAALKRLVAGGAKPFPFPKDVMDAAFKTSMAVYSELSASNPNWKKVYEDYANFRRDQNLWFRFTEARFDSFMQAQKL